MIDRESEYPQTTEFIYSQASGRLKARKLSFNLTDSELAGNHDIKIVNRILNGRRTRNNPYLIPYAYVQRLVDKLGLESDYELFWGDAEDETFIEQMFCNLITDILDESGWRNDSYADIVEKVLLDDVSYARIQPMVISSYEHVNENGDFIPISPLSYLSGGKHPSFSERKQIRQNAIERLFCNTRPIEIFREFFKETTIFSKLGKRLGIFVDKRLMPFMKDNLPTEKSLGLRVYSIVSADLTNYVESELINIERTAAGFDKCNSQEYDEILQSLMEAGREYIDKIEGLQMRLDAILRKEKFGS